MEFYSIEPELENYWRSIILFGRNVASYKFALGKAIHGLNKRANDLVTLEELADPFSMHICEHLKHSPKQVTSKSSKFISACENYNDNLIDKDQLISTTEKIGFNNVIDAFHIVNRSEVDKRFFIDERKTNKGIRLTENFFKLSEKSIYDDLYNEIEARWRLIEESWSLGISRDLIAVHYDEKSKLLYTKGKDRRVDVTSCRDSINGYQKGRCFYCSTEISTEKGDELLGDVDHFFPHIVRDIVKPINGVWNLVLACKNCNRGTDGKFAQLPSLNLLKKLHKRNEYFIESHLPIRQTLILQTGNTEQKRAQFLQKQFNSAKVRLLTEWEPKSRGVNNL